MRKRRRKTDHNEAPPPAMQPARRSWLRRHRWGLAAAAICCTCACVVWALAYDRAPPVYRYRVLNTYSHDSEAFTQGLAHDGANFFEGTGKYGESTLRRVDLESGRVLQSHSLDRSYFGEGVEVWGDRIYQLTWRKGVGIVYDRATFQELGQFKYDGEGWGLTHNGTHLIMSDGTSTLRFLDPQTFQVVRRVMVQSQGRRVGKLNELEYINGEILANVYYKDYVVRISPDTGRVTGWIDLSGLRDLAGLKRNRDAVLNGIAYDPTKDRLFVTGKNWPKLFEIQVTTR